MDIILMMMVNLSKQKVVIMKSVKVLNNVLKLIVWGIEGNRLELFLGQFAKNGHPRHHMLIHKHLQTSRILDLTKCIVEIQWELQTSGVILLIQIRCGNTVQLKVTLRNSKYILVQLKALNLQECITHKLKMRKTC